MELDARGINHMLDLHFEVLEDSQTRRRAEHAAKVVADVVERYEEGVAKIKGEYLPEVVTTRLAAFAKQCRDEVRAATDKILEELRQDEEDMRLKLAPQPPANSADQTALLIERRSLLRGYDNLERDAILTQAFQDNDELTVLAFETAPPFEKLANPELLRDLRERFALKANPTLASRLTETKRLRAPLEAVVSSARSAIPASYEAELPAVVA